MCVCLCVYLLEKCSVSGVVIHVVESWLSKQAVTFTFSETLLIILFQPTCPSRLLMIKKKKKIIKSFLSKGLIENKFKKFSFQNL